MHILFVTATRIGDAVLSTGLFRPSDRTPSRRSRLTIAAGPVAAPLFEAVPGLERLVVVRKAALGAALARPLRRCRGPALGSRRRSARLGSRLDAARRRAPGHGQGRRSASIGCASSARVFDLDPPPSPRLWTAPRHERAAAMLVPAGCPGAGDRPRRQLARQAMAGRTLRRAGASA